MRTSGNAILLGFLLAVFCGPLAAQTSPIPHVNNPLVPAVARPGSPGFTLTVNGAGFVAASVVKWNGSARATTFVSPTKVTAAIQATDVATAASVFVTVTNPSPGGDTSNAHMAWSECLERQRTASRHAVPASLVGGIRFGFGSLWWCDRAGRAAQSHDWSQLL